ncbi:hypothetical protein APHAL10511_002670 [Amanita phalloides]|nr:hypothetical protein APHAL10511_002670 [Amanita phalloides]
MSTELPLRPQVPSTIENIVNLIHDSTRHVPDLHRLSRARKSEFCHDLAFIVLGVRTGCLVDAIFPSDPIADFSNLLRILRPMFPLFGNVMHILDPIGNQSFFVNVPLLRRRLLHLEEIKFVFLPTSESYHLLQGVPIKVRGTLESLIARLDVTCQPLTLSFILRDSSLSVPVAAVLIDYSVAYIPDPTFTSFLHHVPLNVYQCIVKFDSHTHTLLKYSCPVALGERYADSLCPDRVMADLQSRFGSKDRLGRCKEVEVQVFHHVETHDRIAL